MKSNIIVSGSSGLVGYELTKMLLKRNYNVIGCDIKKSKKKISLLKNKNFTILKLDISIHQNVKNFLSFCHKKFGKIDAVINCSYPVYPGSNVKPEFINSKKILFNLSKHLGGTIFLSTEVCKYFNKQEGGRLINISSIQGVCAPKFDHYDSQSFFSPIDYSAIKAGIISITRYLSKYYRKKNINVNCISPGGIISRKHNVKFKKNYLKDCGSIGLLSVNHIIPLIIYLLNDESIAVNGQNIIIDDGWSL